jgi:diguanylate cyclase (GGDEF)-like protein
MENSGTPKIRVLFADADAAFCVFVRYSLEQLGFEITPASNGADLVARFLPELYDVILVGLATPFLDGLQVLRAIKQRSPATPVILLCDDECAHLAEQGMQEGAFAHFEKPLNDFAPLSDAIKAAHARQTAPTAEISVPPPNTFAESLHPLIESTPTQPLSATLQTLVTTCARVAQTPAGIVLLAHSAGYQVFSAYGFPNIEVASRDVTTRVGDAFGARVIAERRTLIEPLPAEPGVPTARQVLGVPILTAAQTLGALILYPLAAPIDPTRLVELELLAAHGALAIEFARLREENLRLISTDPTTGVLKREPFLELADREFRRSWRYNQPITALIVDIDDLAAINHRHGHTFGNQVLRAAADVCVNVIRSIDLIGRYESDAFALLLLMTESDGAQSVAERLRVELNAIHLESAHGTAQITATLGVCSYPRNSCTSIFDLLAMAQEAQRAARFRGANQIIYG